MSVEGPDVGATRLDEASRVALESAAGSSSTRRDAGTVVGDVARLGAGVSDNGSAGQAQVGGAGGNEDASRAKTSDKGSGAVAKADGTSRLQDAAAFV
ncbi:MAG TPA: hypothetical protein VGJ32_10600, partial [Solirubrobacteraceae bacterium]